MSNAFKWALRGVSNKIPGQCKLACLKVSKHCIQDVHIKPIGIRTQHFSHCIFLRDLMLLSHQDATFLPWGDDNTVSALAGSIYINFKNLEILLFQFFLHHPSKMRMRLIVLANQQTIFYVSMWWICYPGLRLEFVSEFLRGNVGEMWHISS